MRVYKENAQPGDIVFFHGYDFVGRMIRLAERIRFKKGSAWNHVAIINGQTDEGWTLYQAQGSGITDTGLLGDSGYFILRLPEGIDRDKVLEFCNGEVGKPYGFLTILSILVTLFMPQFVNVMLPNTWICSAYAAEAMRTGGWYHSWPDLYQTSPAALWEALQGDK